MKEIEEEICFLKRLLDDLQNCNLATDEKFFLLDKLTKELSDLEEQHLVLE